MKVKYDNLWACEDCTMYLANGDIPAKRPNLPAEIHGQWPHDTNLVLGDNADEFSWRQCDCCGSKLGGSRTAFAVLGLTPSTRTGLNPLKKRSNPIMSVLTKKQVKTFKKAYVEGGREYVLIAKVRYDDECGNGHNTFAITGEIWRAKNGQPIGRDCESGGCIHKDITKRLPELAPYIKWHRVSSDEPMHYIANTVYHAQGYGPRYAWIYYTGPSDPLGIEGAKERLLGYERADKAKEAEGQPGYRIAWDEKTAKEANLDHARSSAVWPDATDEDLLAPGLEERLQARLPRLMEEFKAAVESLGFVY